MTKQVLVPLLLGAAAALAAFGADADTVVVRVDINYQGQSEMFPLGPSDGLIRFLSEGTMQSRDDDASGLVGAVGKCFGTGRIAGGQIAGQGACSFTDSDGDLFQPSWVIAPNRMGTGGEWHMVGGTGKWAGAIGGGVWSDEAAADQMTGVTHVDGVLITN